MVELKRPEKKFNLQGWTYYGVSMDSFLSQIADKLEVQLKRINFVDPSNTRDEINKIIKKLRGEKVR